MKWLVLSSSLVLATIIGQMSFLVFKNENDLQWLWSALLNNGSMTLVLSVGLIAGAKTVRVRNRILAILLIVAPALAMNYFALKVVERVYDADRYHSILAVSNLIGFGIVMGIYFAGRISARSGGANRLRDLPPHSTQPNIRE